jgi:predicted acetyltransferase
VRDSFLAAMREFAGEGRGAPDDSSMIGTELRQFSAIWGDPAGFADYVDQLRAQALEETPRPPHHVPCTTLWYVQDNEYLARLAIRHRLTPELLEEGGHIGYDVRPSARRQGHATRMVRLALPIARGIGIARVLITCDQDNLASRRVIEKNGGVLEVERKGKLRYWID